MGELWARERAARSRQASGQKASAQAGVWFDPMGITSAPPWKGLHVRATQGARESIWTSKHIIYDWFINMSGCFGWLSWSWEVLTGRAIWCCFVLAFFLTIIHFSMASQSQWEDSGEHWVCQGGVVWAVDESLNCSLFYRTLAPIRWVLRYWLFPLSRNSCSHGHVRNRNALIIFEVLGGSGY